MKLLEYEAKEIFLNNGIPVPRGVIIKDPEELGIHLAEIGHEVVLKAQVDVGGRGKAGGILMSDAQSAPDAARHLFASTGRL